MKQSRNKGFTLVELLVTIVIAAILLSMAVPSFISIIRDNGLATRTNHFVTAVNLARSEAIKRNARVLICKRSGTACDSSANWEDGWIVFVDQDDDNTVDSGEEIRYFDALTGNYTLRDSNDANWLAFQSNGRIQTNSGGFTMGGTFRLCASDAEAAGDTDKSRNIVINASGRMALSEGAATCP